LSLVFVLSEECGWVVMVVVAVVVVSNVLLLRVGFGCILVALVLGSKLV